MGADLLIDTLVIGEEREPDFAAGHAAIGRLRSEDVEGPDEFFDHDSDSSEGISEIRCELAEALERLRNDLVGDKVSWVEVRGARVYFTGGPDCGEAPTRLFDTIARLRAVRGILTAVGFEGESR